MPKQPTNEDHGERDERKWSEGRRSAWATLLGECIRNLAGEGVDIEAASLLKEREQAIAALRSVCEDHGDNDWPDNLHLADIIEKHLQRHLDG